MIVYKRSDSTLYLGWDFDPELPEGETLLGTSEVAVFDDEGTDVSDTLVKSTTLDGNTMNVIIDEGGTDGDDYSVNFIGRTANLKAVHAVTMKVRNSG